MPWNLPIFLTWTRVALIPLVVGVYYLPATVFSMPSKNLLATVVFVAAALTDWLDGWLARRWNQTSAFGAFLDPVADKLMVAGALLVLLHFDRTNAIIAFIIIGREIAISALREWMAEMGARKNVAVNWLGKLKTIAQMVAIPFLLYDGVLFHSISTRRYGSVLLLIAAALTLASMCLYLWNAWTQIRQRSLD